MHKLLALKAGALFLLLFLVPFLTQIFVVTQLEVDTYRVLSTSLINFLGTGLYCAWVYAACTRLCALLPEASSLNIKGVKLLLLVPAFYVTWTLFNAILVFTVRIEGALLDYVLWVIRAARWMVLLSLICVLVALFYMARLLKTVEYGRPVSAGDCVGDFLRISFFPIGIWTIQPRLNDIATMSRPEEMDIFKQDPGY